MTAPSITNDSLLEKMTPDQTSSSGLITSTARDQMLAAMNNPHLVTGDPADNARLADAASSSRPDVGVPNPYGMSLRAYEPNTESYIAQVSSGQSADIGALSGNDAVKDAASGTADGGDSLKPAAPIDYATGGVADAHGKVQAFINAALHAAALHVPYVWGGTGLNGMDCSGLLYYAAQAAGIGWKRYVAHDYLSMGSQVDQQAARPGDIAVWDYGNGEGHVAIYLGGGKIVAAPQSGENVQVQNVWGNPTFRRVFNDSDFGTAATPGGGSTWNYRGTSWQPHAGAVPGGTPYSNLFSSAGSQYGVPASLLAAVANQESGFDPGARSGAGAIGLMQFMPGTAAGLGVNPYDPVSSVNGAARLLSQYYHQFGSWNLALAAYNAGPGAVQKYGGIPPYAETQNYVNNVTALSQRYGG